MAHRLSSLMVSEVIRCNLSKDRMPGRDKHNPWIEDHQRQGQDQGHTTALHYRNKAIQYSRCNSDQWSSNSDLRGHRTERADVPGRTNLHSVNFQSRPCLRLRRMLVETLREGHPDTVRYPRPMRCLLRLLRSPSKSIAWRSGRLKRRRRCMVPPNRPVSRRRTTPSLCSSTPGLDRKVKTPPVPGQAKSDQGLPRQRVSERQQ